MEYGSVIKRNEPLIPGASQVALVVKNQPANAGDVRDSGLIPGLGRAPGGGHGNSLQYSCLENPMDRGAWRASPWGHRVRNYWSDLAHTHTHTYAHMRWYPSNLGVSPGHDAEWNSGSQKSHTAWLHLYSVPQWQNHRAREQIDGCQRLGMRAGRG